MFDEAVRAGLAREAARDRVVEFLKAQKNVKEVRITGSDSLRVFFADGNDLLMMLGKERL
jgi:L-lysine 2,3-aminomutase